MSKFPSSLEEILTLVQNLYPSRVEIAPKAFDSAKKYFEKHSGTWKKIDKLNLAWSMMWHFANNLYEILFNLPDGGNPVLLLKERKYPFDLALNEGKQTKKNKKFMDLRTIDYEGKD